jgi:signal transduction histidine kinase
LELRLKNILIKKQAQKLLEIEQKTIKQNLLERDNERQRIGHQLEEDFAQVLTSVSHYLSIAQNNHELMGPCINKCKEQVDHLLKNIHRLSKSIVPTTLRSASLQEMLIDYVFRFQQIVSFKISLSMAEQEEIRGAVAFSLFRIVETQLSIISGKKKVQHVLISLSVEESRVTLKITDDGIINRSVDLELMMNTIIKRVDMHDGSFSIENDEKEGGLLMAMLPLG